MNCLRCGACCRAFGIVEIADCDQISEDLTAATELGYARMKTDGFVCCCLKDNICTIYDNRPIVCRKFTPHSDLCKMARVQVGLDI